MTGLIVLAVFGGVLTLLAAFAASSLIVLIPAIAIPDIGRNALGIAAIPISVLGLLIASYYSARLAYPLLQAYVSRGSIQKSPVPREFRQDADECKERVERAFSFRIALSGLLRPEAYPVQCRVDIK